jgi:predicted transcriptional regulator
VPPHLNACRLTAPFGGRPRRVKHAGAHDLPVRSAQSPAASHFIAPDRCNGLLDGAACLTMYDMKTSTLTIRLDPALDRQVTQAAKRTGLSRSEIVREAVRRQLSLVQFQDLRRRIMPLAEARGYLTDEDVFRDVS